ncbi:MAG: TIGR04076 family protein [Deltaproteobacteria bacterium]|uniref:TIGR04076 family protein n=1 Tax=Candidatus Zymogenus saltonus TaxID=2844893 RepID=A0A9D8PS68_9DELT|nr:TIGR04076 family protein [Candidatus Zymogenus saltonus]
MKIDKETWDLIQKHLGYNDEEMKIFKENPRNEAVISKTSELIDKTIIFEVIKSEGCNSQHKVGDKFYFDGKGNLMTKLCPKRICVHALGPLSALVFTANELIYAGADPNEMRFPEVSCPDVGLECGGWGQIVMKLRVEDRKR